METNLPRRIGRKDGDTEALARQATRAPERIAELLAGLGAREARVRHGCAKALRLIAERRPQALYPHFQAFADLLGGENKILWWEGLLVIGHLAGVDREGRIDGLLERYLAPLAGPVMITAGNAMAGAARIAAAKPHLADRIARAIMTVEQAQYQTAECRNVALGHAVKALGEFYEQLGAEEREKVVEFVRRQLGNTRAATRGKAERFLRRHASAAS